MENKKKQKPNYTCPRCGYETIYRNNMRQHLYNTKRPCICSVRDIELTDDIKNFVLANRVFRFSVISNDNTYVRTRQSRPFGHINPSCEKFYQILLEKHLGGGHKTLPNGQITDITTDQFHAEIKNWSNYMAAIGQIMCYNNIDPRSELRIYFFGKEKDRAKIEIINQCLRLNINPFYCELENDNLLVFDQNHNIVWSCVIE